jgi:hypothetical protein
MQLHLADNNAPNEYVRSPIPPRSKAAGFPVVFYE